jgi:hypothetical protein
VLEKLDQLVDEISSLNSKLILLIGPPRSGKTALLNELANRRQTRAINVGSALGRQLLSVSSISRHLKVAELLKALADGVAVDGLELLDNIELLFDQTLQLNPLDLLKRHAHVRRVVASWPGELHDDRLTYARMGHPEYRDYGIDGLVPFKIH